MAIFNLTFQKGEKGLMGEEKNLSQFVSLTFKKMNIKY
ncbi:hypothetical protein DFR59_110101 [Falsibacillus pallidus]|uniref:Uncharacterized protein n=1 Tax=Falsibacillus pallidus TaxID=493781 RepID=A0A370GBM3_9BACI|nr:hypothetical protein DFR59_110101 [Falsibacillus pallidus]